MKANLNRTEQVEVTLPEFFKYSRFGKEYYCRILSDGSIAEVTERGSNVYLAETVLSEMAKIDINDFSEISQQTFVSRATQITEMICR